MGDWILPGAQRPREKKKKASTGLPAYLNLPVCKASKRTKAKTPRAARHTRTTSVIQEWLATSPPLPNKLVCVGRGGHPDRNTRGVYISSRFSVPVEKVDALVARSPLG